MTCRTLISMHRLAAAPGREDQLKASGQLEQLAASFARLDPPAGPGGMLEDCITKASPSGETSSSTSSPAEYTFMPSLSASTTVQNGARACPI